MAALIQTLQSVISSTDPLLSNETRRILLKEALQAFVLDFLYNHNHYRSLNLYGGTCLRLVYQLNRMSEDIDLDNQQGIDLHELATDLVAYFHQVFDYREASVKQQQGKGGILRLTLKFPLLRELGLSQLEGEALHLKMEISHHRQVAVIHKTPVLYYSRSFVPSHFSLETMMAAKVIACLERTFQKGTTGVLIKGRDFYDLLWFMQQGVRPLEEKLAHDGSMPYTTQSAFAALQEKVTHIRPRDLAVDLLPLFEQRSFIEQWIEAFQPNFERWVVDYLRG